METIKKIGLFIGGSLFMVFVMIPAIAVAYLYAIHFAALNINKQA